MNTELSDVITEENSIFETIFIIIKASIPISLESLFIFLTETLNIFFIGNYMKSDWLSAYSLSSFIIVCFGVVLIAALTGSIDTLSSNAYGAKKYKNIGINITIGIIVNITALLVIYVPIAFNSRVFFNFILDNSFQDTATVNINSNSTMNLTFGDYNYTSQGGFSQLKEGNLGNEVNYYFRNSFEVDDFCNKASYIVKITTITLFIEAISIVLSRTLVSMRIFKINMIISLVCLVLHPLWLYIFVVILKYEYNGVFLSNMISSQLALFMFVYIYAYSNSINQEAMPYFNLKDISKNIISYIYLSIYSFFYYFLETFQFEVMVLVSSFLSKESMSANFILQNYATIIFFIGNGVSCALCAYVGNAIGEKSKNKVIKLIKSGYIIGIILGCIFSIVTYFNSYRIVSFYTHDKKIISEFEGIIGIYCICCIFELPQIAISGINEGLGRQKYIAILSFLSVYIIGIPIMLLLTFYYQFYLKGIWTGSLINYIFLLIAYSLSIIIKNIDTTIKDNELHLKGSLTNHSSKEL